MNKVQPRERLSMRKHVGFLVQTLTQRPAKRQGEVERVLLQTVYFFKHCARKN